MDANEKKLYVNEAEGMARLRNNANLYKRMLGLFVKSPEFAAFEEAYAAGDITRAGEVAHAIKGSSGNLSLTRVFELTNQMMLEMRQGVDNKELVAEYRDALEKTLTIIKEITA
jgi:HPt (histidine-containing phosphotransfer) domain-containing protein